MRKIFLFFILGILLNPVVYGDENYINLKKAKYFLVNGNIKKARYHLEQIEDEKQLKPTVLRYKALIYFLQNDYLKSNKILQNKTYESVNWNTETCLIKIINDIALNEYNLLNEDYKSCKYLTFDYTKNRNLWLDYMVNLKLRRITPDSKDSDLNLRIFFSELETIKIWLKKNIYLNKEDLNLEKLYALPKFAFKNKSVREVIGLSYYRKGNEKKALDFIEDLDGPNASNIKGIINLKQKKYEIAFGHFQLALKKKENSGNALKRAIPLSWMLDKYETGLKLLDRFIFDDIDPFRRLALTSAFKIQLGKIQDAEIDLRHLNMEFQGNMPLKIMLANSYVALNLSQLNVVKKYSSLACKKFDGLNCWTLMQLFIWDDLSKVINNTGPVRNKKYATLDSLKKKAVNNPLDENPIIDQSYIEELDSEQVLIKE